MIFENALSICFFKYKYLFIRWNPLHNSVTEGDSKNVIKMKSKTSIQKKPQTKSENGVANGSKAVNNAICGGCKSYVIQEE